MSETFSRLSGGIQGPRRMEGVIVSRTRSGRTLVARKPGFDPRLKYSGKKNSIEEEMRHAVTYAEFACDQPLYQCKAAGTLKTAYSLAMADYLGKPQILDIDVRNWNRNGGRTILVKARDNFVVLSVRLVIRDGETILDQGEAEQSPMDSLIWRYTLGTPVTRKPGLCIEAFAYDLPGTVGEFSIELR